MALAALPAAAQAECPLADGAKGHEREAVTSRTVPQRGVNRRAREYERVALGPPKAPLPLNSRGLSTRERESLRGLPPVAREEPCRFRSHPEIRLRNGERRCLAAVVGNPRPVGALARSEGRSGFGPRREPKRPRVSRRRRKLPGPNALHNSGARLLEREATQPPAIPQVTGWVRPSPIRPPTRARCQPGCSRARACVKCRAIFPKPRKAELPFDTRATLRSTTPGDGIP
jgi:hypothetical protein